jgi:hypothetical protein
MFYCDPCGNKRGWPFGWFKSLGPCEICHQTRLCGDVPSGALPVPAAREPMYVMPSDLQRELGEYLDGHQREALGNPVRPGTDDKEDG